MFGLIVIAILLVLCVIIPPLAFIKVPFILVSLITGWFLRSLTSSITKPIGNDVKWAGERIASAIEGPKPEPDPEEWDDDSISPALQAAQEDYAEEQTRKATGSKTVRRIKRKINKKKDNEELIQDIEDFLKK